MTAKVGRPRHKESLLEAGRVPPYDVCPLKSVCPRSKECRHMGRSHEVHMTCAMAVKLDRRYVIGDIDVKC